MPDCFGELPYDPQMGIPLEAAQRGWVTEFRFKNNGRFKILHLAALPRNAEFGRKISMHSRNDLYVDIFHLGTSLSEAEADSEP